MYGLRKHLSFIYFIVSMLGFAMLQKWLQLDAEVAKTIAWGLTVGFGAAVGANVGAKFSPEKNEKSEIAQR